MVDPVRQVVEAQAKAISQGLLSMWTVYDKPKDYPDATVARRFEIEGGQERATDDLLRASLEELRRVFDEAGLYRIMRAEDDEPHIVEVWL